MEEVQKQMEQELEVEIVLKRKENEIRRTIKRKRMMLEKQMRDDDEEDDKLLQDEILRERKLQLERMRTRQQSFVENMQSLARYQIGQIENCGAKGTASCAL